MQEIWLYYLTDPRTAFPAYIGQAKKLPRRYAEHKTRYKYESNKKAKWIAELAALGLEPGIEPIKQVPAAMANAEELFLMEYFKFLGCNLFNTMPNDPALKNARSRGGRARMQKITPQDQARFGAKQKQVVSRQTLSEWGKRGAAKRWSRQ